MTEDTLKPKKGELVVETGVKMDIQLNTSSIAKVAKIPLMRERLQLTQSIKAVTKDRNACRKEHTAATEKLQKLANTLADGHETDQAMCTAAEAYYGEKFVTDTKLTGVNADKKRISIEVTIRSEADSLARKSNRRDYYSDKLALPEKTVTLDFTDEMNGLVAQLEELAKRDLAFGQELDAYAVQMSELGGKEAMSEAVAEATVTLGALGGRMETREQMLELLQEVMDADPLELLSSDTLRSKKALPAQ